MLCLPEIPSISLRLRQQGMKLRVTLSTSSSARPPDTDQPRGFIQSKYLRDALIKVSFGVVEFAVFGKREKRVRRGAALSVE